MRICEGEFVVGPCFGTLVIVVTGLFCLNPNLVDGMES